MPFASRTWLFDAVSAPALGAWTGVLGMAQALRPLRRDETRGSRLVTHIALGVLAAAAERALVVPALVATARYAARKRLGLLRAPAGPLRVLLGIAGLDLGMYAWHRASHQSAVLWRFHGVHHTDRALDLTTAIRLHPGELLLSIPVRCAQVLLLGTSPGTVLTYELLMQAAALFHHTSVDLGAERDAAAARLLMTPRLHTRHHAVRAEERDCNWGIVLSLWDRLFRSLERRQARDPRLGTEQAWAWQELRARALLTMPWSRSA